MIDLPPILTHGWRHPTSGRVHVQSDCPAVRFNRRRMIPVLIRLDDANEAAKHSGATACRWCFPGRPTT
jgi:hypothetical protein